MWNISPNASGHIEDASLKSVDININNWFGGADHNVSEEFAADRRHDLRVQSVCVATGLLGETFS